jgi:hypothetical protein
LTAPSRAVAGAGIAAVVLLALVIVAGGPAVAAAALAVVAGAALLARRPSAPHARGRAVLLLLLLPALVHFHAGGGRINGDGVSYYVYVRSLAKDADLDFTNEYAHYGMLEREDLAVPTRTGRRRSIFSVGPGLAWLPFFAFGEAAARAAGLLGFPADLSGYGPFHVNAVALGSLLMGFAAVLLVHHVAGRHFPPGIATAAAAAVWLATFLYWYMVEQPTMSHAPSTLGAALVVWWWDRTRAAPEARAVPRVRAALVLGLLIGIAMCLRWQNALLGLLPAYDLARAAWRPTAMGSVLRGMAALLAGTLAGALPQMAAWRVLYGDWVLLDPPHGADFLRLFRPFVLETLFSSRHGLLWWTPILWLGFLGLLPLARRRPALARPLLLPVALMTYVNMCSGDWWAGGSFSNRRFDSLLPILALGLAASFEVARALVARRPAVVPLALAVTLGVAHVAVTEGVRERERAPVAFPDAAGAGAARVARTYGSPPSWPASWAFAARHRLPPGQYDLLVGRYLFYRQNNLRGRIELGGAGDEALRGEGWGASGSWRGREGRALSGRARILAPLDVPEDLALDVHASAGGSSVVVSVTVNGTAAGRFVAGGAWGTHRIALPRALWRRDLNDLVLDSGGATVWIDALQFTRSGAADGRERGFEAR